MRVISCLICIVYLLCFNTGKSNAEFTSAEDNIVIAKDGTEYIDVGIEGEVCTFGDSTFLGYIYGEKESFFHLDIEIKTGMYAVDNKRDVLLRYLPDNEFYSIYVKSGLIETEVAAENCVRFVFAKFNSNSEEILNSQKGTTECEEFLNAIKSGESAQDAGLYDLVKQPNGAFKNRYVYGYVYGIIQEGLNIAIPMEVMSFDDKAYSITIDNAEYVLPMKWLEELSN